MTNDQLMLKSVVKVFNILEYLSLSKANLTLTELSRHTQISLGGAQRITQTLLNLGYLQKDSKTKTFKLTTKWLHIGFAAINQINLRELSLPHLKQLNKEINETISLAALDVDQVIYIERINTSHFVGTTGGPGMTRPLHCSAMGKVIWAFLSEDERENILNRIELTKYSENTIVDKMKLKNELKKIQDIGYAENNCELTSDIYAVAVPLLNSEGIAVAGINIVIPMSRISRNRVHKEFLPLLIEKGKLISESLGYDAV